MSQQNLDRVRLLIDEYETLELDRGDIQELVNEIDRLRSVELTHRAAQFAGLADVLTEAATKLTECADEYENAAEYKGEYLKNKHQDATFAQEYRDFAAKLREYATKLRSEK